MALAHAMALSACSWVCSFVVLYFLNKSSYLRNPK